MSARAALRIGIDVRAALKEPCGIGRYSTELARALLAADPSLELLLYAASRAGRPAVQRLPEELRVHPRVRLFAHRLPAKLLNLAARLPGFRLEWLTGPLDLFHHTDLIFLKGFACPEIVTVHDIAFEVSRDFHDEGFHKTVRQRMRGGIARARAVIVPSAATKRDLVQLWNVPAEDIVVIPLGADHVLRVPRGERQEVRRGPGAAARPYLLFVGAFEPRKNLVRLVRAFAAARARGLAQELVLVGAPGWCNDDLWREIAQSPARDAIGVRGAVEEPELKRWFEEATALVYPSLYEGFGLPVVEAFALGVPVVTSDRSAMKEVAGDAALLVDPEDEAALAAALLRIGTDGALRAALVARGRARVASITWSAAAGAVLDLYEEVLSDRQSAASKIP